jgi:ElaB/YqjD/DUF883 family membrane-anchored ribosome-binding protein
MTDRYEIQKELERKLAQGEAALEKLNAKLADAGDEASDEMHEAARSAERALERGQAKLAEMKDATDEQFEEMWHDAKEAWHHFANDAERGWDSLSDKVKSFFA